MTLKLAARKLRADELGNETEIPLDEEMDVGAMDAEGSPCCWSAAACRRASRPSPCG